MKSLNIEKSQKTGFIIRKEVKQDYRFHRIHEIIKEDIFQLSFHVQRDYSGPNLTETQKNCIDKLIWWALNETYDYLSSWRFSNLSSQVDVDKTKKTIIRNIYRICVVYLYNTYDSKLKAERGKNYYLELKRRIKLGGAALQRVKKETIERRIRELDEWKEEFKNRERRHRVECRNLLRYATTPPCTKLRDTTRLKEAQRKIVYGILATYFTQKYYEESSEFKKALHKKFEIKCSPTKSDKWIMKRKKDFFIKSEKEFACILTGIKWEDISEEDKAMILKLSEDPLNAPADFVNRIVQIRENKIPDKAVWYKPKKLWFGNLATLSDKIATKKNIGWPTTLEAQENKSGRYLAQLDEIWVDLRKVWNLEKIWRRLF